MNIKGQNSKRKGPRNDSLIEALRQMGSDVSDNFTNDFLGKIPQDIFTQSGLKPTNQFDFPSPENSYRQENENFLQRFRKVEKQRHQEKLVFTAKERETKAQVTTLIGEVKKLSEAVGNLDQSIKTVVMQEPVDPGVYHLGFFEKLIAFLRSLTQKVEDATAWATAASGKAKKRSYYWGQVKKSGAKFLLSQERYMSTQAG